MDNLTQNLLEKNIYCVVSTTNKDGSPWAVPVHFAFDKESIYWLSSRDAQHSLNIAEDQRVFITVFDSRQSFASSDERGAVYVSTTARLLDGDEEMAARDIYADRFSDENARRLAEWGVYKVSVGEINQQKTQGSLVYYQNHGVPK